MHRRPGSTLRAAKQALLVDTSLSPVEVFQHLEILERQKDGPSVVQQRYFEAYEAALGVMEALDEALLRPDVRLTGRLVQGHWNQSAEIRIRVHAAAEEVRAVLEHLAFDTLYSFFPGHDRGSIQRVLSCRLWFVCAAKF